MEMETGNDSEIILAALEAGTLSVKSLSAFWPGPGSESDRSAKCSVYRIFQNSILYIYVKKVEG